MMSTLGKIGLVLLACMQLISALNTAELDQFQQGNGYNHTVKITDNNDGTLTFSVYKACRRTGDKPASPRATTPSIAEPPVDETPILPGIPDGTPDMPLKLIDDNCTDHELSLTVNSSPVAIQAPDQPAALPDHPIVGLALDGHPIIQGKSKSRGKKRGGKRSSRRGGSRRGGRGGRRGGKRGRRDVNRARNDDHEERRAMMEAEDQLLGVALDGYPIYSANSSEVADRLLQTSDLDQCGGRCDASGNYRYHAVQVGDGDEGDAKVVIHLGCIKGELIESAFSGLKPRRGDDDDDKEGSGEGDEGDEDERDEEKYRIACDADASVGSCVSSATVSEDSYECVEVESSGSGDDESGSSDSDSSDSSVSSDSDSSDSSVSNNRRSESRRRIRQRVEENKSDDDGDVGSTRESDGDDDSDSDSSSRGRSEGSRRFRSRFAGRSRNGRRRN